MSITGGAKFFELSANLYSNGAKITASTGNSGASGCLDRNPSTYWRSVGSNDSTTETLTISFSAGSTLINRLLLIDHNWKNFSVKYNVSGVWTDFAGVVGMDGSKSNVSETACTDGTSYYEFNSVTTDQIQITITSTQIANAQKFLSQVIATSELGTFQGFPTIKKLGSDRNARQQKTLSGKYVVMKSIETLSFQLDFKDYPRSSVYSVDFDLIMTLQDRETEFIVWLCGGRRGTKYFGYTLRGLRTLDALVMQITKPLSLSYSKGIYQAGLNSSLVLEEHI